MAIDVVFNNKVQTVSYKHVDALLSWAQFLIGSKRKFFHALSKTKNENLTLCMVT